MAKARATAIPQLNAHDQSFFDSLRPHRNVMPNSSTMYSP